MSGKKINSEDLNGLALTLKQIIDGNLQNLQVREKVRKMKGKLVLKEKQSGISATIIFNKGEVTVRNDAATKSTAFIEAGFIELADISSGRLGPAKAFLTGKIKAKGNLVKLLRMSKVLICR